VVIRCTFPGHSRRGSNLCFRCAVFDQRTLKGNNSYDAKDPAESGHCNARRSLCRGKIQAFCRLRSENGNNSLANLLTEVADESRIGHFAKEVQLAGLISDDIANLRDVVRDKHHHIERYSQFAAEVEQDGDVGAAGLFKALVTDDKRQVGELEKILAEYQERKS
jgi:hypothetical protein